MHAFLAALLFILPSLSHAATTFSPQCTLSNQTVNYVSSPDRRGTLDILWSCLFTIFACTWTVLHLNVPKQREGRDRYPHGPWYKKLAGDLKWGLKGTQRTCKWMVMTVFAPEMTFVISLDWLVHARRIREKFCKLGKDVEEQWTLTHIIYASMGGFVLRTSSDDVDENDDVHLAILPNSLPCPEGGEHNIPPSTAESPNTLLAEENTELCIPYHLLPETILAAIEKEILPRKPPITEDEINDKSKSDAFGKTIAVVQIMWFCINVLVRGIRSLSVSHLEIAVVAFSACSIAIYVVNFKKPKAVNCATTLKSFNHRIPESILGLQRAAAANDYGGVYVSDLARGSALSTWLVTKSNIRYFEYGLLLQSVLFGGIHIVAWNFDFPSNADRWLWRCAAIVSTTIVPAAFLMGWFMPDFDRLDPNIPRTSALLYILARLILIVEMFRLLFYLPPDAFIATWASSFPHIG